MRLLSTKSREYKGKEYRKYFVILSNKLINELGWKQGDELEAEAKGDKLIIDNRQKLER